MQILIKQPGIAHDPEIRDVESGLKSMQAIVGGWIESIHIPELAKHGIDCFGNEEAKLIGLNPSFLLPWGDTVAGTVFFASHNDEGETIGLSDDQVEKAKVWLSAQPQAILF